VPLDEEAKRYLVFFVDDIRPPVSAWVGFLRVTVDIRRKHPVIEPVNDLRRRLRIPTVVSAGCLWRKESSEKRNHIKDKDNDETYHGQPMPAKHSPHRLPLQCNHHARRAILDKRRGIRMGSQIRGWYCAVCHNLSP